MNNEGKTEVLVAERAVTRSLSKFESAMDDFSRSVDEMGEAVQNIVGFARMPKEELRILGERFTDFWKEIRRNPQPYILAACSALALVGFRTWRRRRADSNYSTADLKY